MLFSLIILSACERDGSQNNEIPPKKEIKKITGTFVDFWSKGDWTTAQWEEHFEEMREMGITTAIIQFVAFKNSSNNITWFNSANTFTQNKKSNSLTYLMEAAQKKQIDVYIGLYFDDTYWNHQTDVEWLKQQADNCIFIAEEINALFNSNTAFKGWYIPHEPEPTAYNTVEKVKLFKDYFVNRISDRLHQINNKPVSIAAFWNSKLSSPNDLQHFMRELSKSNLQIIMLQDGVGVEHVTLDKLAIYYQSAEKGLYGKDSSYKGEFWADIETFKYPRDERGLTPPADFDRIFQQISIAFNTTKLKKVVSFQYYNDMSPKGSFKNSATKLRQKYYDYIHNLL